jgi:hypothetical protein
MISWECGCRKSRIDFADDDLESQADVGGLVYAGTEVIHGSILAAPKILTGRAQLPIQFGFNDSARQILSVHRKLPKS